MPEATRARKAGAVRIVMTPQWCKGCGICVELCPAKVFTAEEGTGKAAVTFPEKCSDCGMCELWCPDYAISLERGVAG